MGKKPKILVVGSFVMDQIVTTRVFPRQGQTILAERFNKAPGGKGANQAVQARSRRERRRDAPHLRRGRHRHVLHPL